MAAYYVLDQAHMEPFLPFLSSGHQKSARQGRIYVAGAVEDGLAVGAAAFSVADGEAALLSVAVSPAYQRQGIAGGLLRYLRGVLPALDGFALNASLAPGHPAEEAVTALMERCGAQRLEGPETVSCPISALRSSPLLQPLLKGEARGVVPMSQVPHGSLRALNADLRRRDVIAAPLNWSAFDAELSFFGLTEGQEISCCICARQVEDAVHIGWLYTTPTAARRMAAAVVALVRACEGRFPADARFTAVLMDDGAKKLLERLAGSEAAYTAAPAWRWDLLH